MKLPKQDRRFLSTVRGKIGKAIREYDMIADSDRILVGLSGGKDSLVLLENLAMRRHIKDLNYEVFAVHVDIINIPYQTDIEYLEAFCKQWDISFINKQFEIDLTKKPGAQPCFICSWQRRRALFKQTEVLNCNKLAFGHHKDDAVETLLLNMIYHGSISSIPALLPMFGGRVTAIRPLIFLRNHELKRYAAIRQFEQPKQECPYGNSSQREMVRHLVARLEEEVPASHANIFGSMSKLFPEYLPHPHHRPYQTFPCP